MYTHTLIFICKFMYSALAQDNLQVEKKMIWYSSIKIFKQAEAI